MMDLFKKEVSLDNLGKFWKNYHKSMEGHKMSHTFTFNKYEEAKNTTKIISCDECGHSWVSKETDLHKDRVDVKGEILVVTYFTCPNCNKLYVVGIDNHETLRLRKMLSIELKRLNRDNDLGKDTSKRSKKVSRMYQQLREKGTLLKSTYNGIFYQKSTS